MNNADTFSVYVHAISITANRNPDQFFHHPAHHIHETLHLMEYYHSPDAHYNISISDDRVFPHGK